MTLTLNDLDPSTASAACPEVLREFRRLRPVIEAAADKFHASASRLLSIEERGLANAQTRKALVDLRRCYFQLDEIRDQLDREAL